MSLAKILTRLTLGALPLLALGCGGITRLGRHAAVQPMCRHARRLGAAPSEAAALMSLVEPRNRALAERVEAATSPRHRHLLLAGLHVGVYAAAVALLPDGPARPDAARIAEHASLAGVPEPLWRPLTQVPAATGAARKRSGRRSIAVGSPRVKPPSLFKAFVPFQNTRPGAGTMPRNRYALQGTLRRKPSACGCGGESAPKLGERCALAALQI